MLAALDEEKDSLQVARTRVAERLQKEISECDEQLDTLLDLILSKSISQAEYASKKQTLLGRKIDIREQLASLTGESAGRFEPITEFVKSAKQAVFLAEKKNPDACRDFVRKHGSNFLLTDGRLSFEFKKPLETLAIFNSQPVATIARQRGIPENEVWRREGD